MKKCLRRPSGTGLCLVLALSLWGCAGAQETAEDGESRRASTQANRAAEIQGDLKLAPTSQAVRTIQLYPTQSGEANLPILPLRGGTLTLEFDLMEPSGRPLSAYFYHADRSWRRDLSPSEYLESFQRDDLLDYQPSIATEIRYTHYNYTFPNNDIRFLLSGNYVLRITEQGREDTVLFETPFFITEQVTSLEFALDNIMLGGSPYASTQPVVRFAPPRAIEGNVFDFNVCFVRNGAFSSARCSDRPTLNERPNLLFYLEPELSFRPEIADYFLDVSNLRLGGQIERIDYEARPYEVLLEPDYARFGPSGLAPLLNGRPVVDDVVRDVGTPDLEGEYLNVLFSYVPPNESPLGADLLVTGSFNGWQQDPANKLSWVADAGRYEGEVLMKQGQYEYRYLSRDPGLRRALQGALPRNENLYTAFVYFSDITKHTDRLLAVNGLIAH